MSPSLKTIDGDTSVGEIKEVSVRVSKNDVEAAFNGSKNKISQLKGQPGAINVIIPDYIDIGFTTEKMDILSNFESYIHTKTDVIVVPRWSGVLANKDGSMLDDLIDHSKKYIDESRILNGKPLMGNIPLSIPGSLVEKLVMFYINEGITSFVLDYGTCLPQSKQPLVRNIQKILLDTGHYENSILYSTNVRRTHKTGDIFPAEDLLTFCDGIDIIGNLHLGGGSSRNDRPEPKTKRFIADSYTYVETAGLNDSEKRRLKNLNCKLQNEETGIISKEIQQSRSSYDYLKEKTGAKEHLDGCGSKQPSLDLFF